MFLIIYHCLNLELKLRIEKYFKGDEEALPSVLEAILARRLLGKHEDTDDELAEELQFTPIDDVGDKEFESDFEESHKTDEDIPDLYNAKEIVVNRMMEDEYYNMDDQKWNAIVQEATEKGFARDMRECEEILEDMRDWDKLLPGIFIMSSFKFLFCDILTSFFYLDNLLLIH